MSKTTTANRQARLMAIQALYQHDFRGQSAGKIVEEFIASWLTPQTNRALFIDLVSKTVEHLGKIDGMIAPRLQADWTLERLDPVLLSLLRVAAAEVWLHPDTPAKMLIFDYVMLAKAFFDHKEPAFVNQVLDSITRELRPDELPARE